MAEHVSIEIFAGFALFAFVWGLVCGMLGSRRSRTEAEADARTIDDARALLREAWSALHSQTAPFSLPVLRRMRAFERQFEGAPE